MHGITPPKLGHRILDAEHEVLLQFAWICSTTCKSVKNIHDCNHCLHSLPRICHDNLKDALDRLMSVVHDHFVSEERIMREVGVAEQNSEYFAAHINAHQLLGTELNQIAMEISAETPDSVAKIDVVAQIDRLHDFITDKLLGHLYKVDTGLIPYLSKPI